MSLIIFKYYICSVSSVISNDDDAVLYKNV